MEVCFLCGEVLLDRPDSIENMESLSNMPLKHEEHIIQDAIRGKLKSTTILCESCGGKLSEVDADFVKLFAPFVEDLKGIIARKDHGKSNKSKTLNGYLFRDGDSAEKIEVDYRDKQVSPRNPYHEIDSDKMIIYIYANKIRGKQYKNQVFKILQDEGFDPESFQVKYITDISDKGNVGLFFIEGNENNFQEQLFLGLNKIATGFASYHGINRIDLPRTLDIDQQRIISSKNIFPFFPIGSFDLLYEYHRPELESSYPSHTLLLFTVPKANSKKILYCYVDLFSTFQYFVILNENFEGHDICEQYSQTLLKQEIPKIDVRRIRPKHLRPFLNDFGIDLATYNGNSINDLYDFAEIEYRRLCVNHEIDLPGMLANIADQLLIAYHQYKHQQNPNKNKDIVNTFESISPLRIPAFLMEANSFHQKDSTLYRRCFYEDDGYNDLELLFTPSEVLLEFNKSDRMMKGKSGYGYLKFQQLERFVIESNSKHA